MRQGDDGRDDRVALAIMAKAPRAGEVKTRLTPPLPAEDAAALYHAFLRDKIEQVRALAGVQPAIVFAPAAAEPFFRALAPDFSLVPQRGADLGERITAAFDDLLDAGAPAALIDSDTPDLPREFLEEAIERLADPETDVLVGPSDDGGYYLIGLRVARPALFSDMPWSTPAVLPETMRRAQGLGLRVTMLPRWSDVDTAEDLRRLESVLAAAPGPHARHTRAFLAGRREGAVRR